ncbi:MAG: TolC family protein [Chitinophagaceae bacterium]|nr:TolC family protein [Chitinophagaceae bacterium]
MNKSHLSMLSNKLRVNKRIRLMIFFYIAYLVSTTSFAQTLPVLSLQEAVIMGLENSKQLQITQAKAVAADAKNKQTYDLAYPMANLTAGYSRLSDVPAYLIQFPGETEAHELFPVYLNNYQTRLSVNELVFAGLKLKYGKSSADYLNQAAAMDVDKDKDEVAFNIVNAYFNIYKLTKGVVIIDQNLALVKQQIKELQDGEREGITLHNDVVRAQLQQTNFELAAIDATNSLKTAIYDFNLLIGISPPETPTKIDTSSVFQTPTLQTLDQYLQVAAATRSDLESQKTRNLAAMNSLIVEQKDYWPTIFVGGNIYYGNPNVRYIPPVDQFNLTWDIGANLNWNLTTLFTNKHQVAESKAIVLQGKTAYDQLSDVVKSEVYSSYLGYTESTDKLTTLEKALVQATENYNLQNSRYTNSVALFSDLIDAQSYLLLAQINYSIGKADGQVAYYKLLKATGTIQ